MSETLIADLQKRINELTTENASLKTEAKGRRHKNKSLQEEVDGLKAQVASLATERDGLKAAATAQPHELQTKIDELQGKLRDRDHRDKFRELAKAKGVTQEKALDDLWQLSGYKPDADEIDEPKLTAAITSALAGRDWLKAAAPDGANGQPPGGGTQSPQGGANGNRQPGPGANRGSGAGDNAIDTDAQFRAVTGHGNAFRIA
jgi:FtsZ-binding cell division protein ZapB